MKNTEKWASRCLRSIFLNKLYKCYNLYVKLFLENTHSLKIIFLWMCILYCMYVCVLVAQSSLTLCDPTDCSPQSFSVHGNFQWRKLEWIAFSFSRGLPDSGIESWSPALLSDYLPVELQGSPCCMYSSSKQGQRPIMNVAYSP